ncbi:zinc finger family protein [Trypanosoma theileri]|uniref:E3 ubiquitin-protein ligase CHFR n=1 Tax=Trypanosoma theileri TaxID=67003 RepID=A0A1X0NPC5_9TRYP|nr:zinc finger family protein [Trypanosoma theileri]ORC86039.1 zinc finger family protein [Trypanosoma theileri]
MSNNINNSVIDRISSWEVAAPDETHPTDSVEDAFELLAPSANGPLVARLLPVQEPSALSRSCTIDIYRDMGSLILGRSKELVVEHRVDVARVSGQHCELRINPLTKQVTVRDLSTNGTYINGVRIERGVDVELQSGDRLSLTKPTESTDVDTPSAEYVFQRVTNEVGIEKMEQELTCSVCTFIYLRPCSLLPCMHVFCASCISKWLAEGNSTCMECRAKVFEVRPTHKLQNCVEQFLNGNPHLKRTPEEEAACVAFDDIPPSGKILRKRLRDADMDDNDNDDDDNHSSNSGEHDDSDSDGNNQSLLAPIHYRRNTYGHFRPTGPCRHCEAPSTVDGYSCPEGGLHHSCVNCQRLFPQRPLCSRPQCCQLCNIPHCNLYYEEEGGCPCGSSGGLTRLRQYCPPSTLPQKTFGGNMIEQSILSRYLSSKNISIEAVWKECMSKMQSNDWIPDITCVNDQLTADSALCEGCMETVFASLLFHYRRAIPSSDLPESVTQRPNCWYGVNCRTQFHNTKHANSYNHVCYQEKRKE